MVRENFDLVLAGNHDHYILGKGDERFPPEAPARVVDALRKAQEELSEDEIEWIRDLEPVAERMGLELFHGTSMNPFFQFLDYEASLAHLESQKTRISVVGHTHVPAAFRKEGWE